MRPALAPAAALAAALCAAVPSAAQEAQASLGASTGFNLLPNSLLLIEATRAGVAFEGVPDTRFRRVRHMATRFPCMFQPDSEAVVTVVAQPEGGVAPGEDAVCFEHIDDTDIAYRITRFPGQTLEEVFAAAAGVAPGWLSGNIAEAPSAPILTASPHQPDVELDMPRDQLLVLGDTANGRAMLRIAVVQLPNDWYITQNYFAPLTDVPPERELGTAVLGSALAEAGLVIQLSEMLSPTPDPVLQATQRP